MKGMRDKSCRQRERGRRLLQRVGIGLHARSLMHSPLGFGVVSMTCRSFMFEISYMYISTSSTITSVLRFILTARIEEGKRSSQIMDCRYM